MRPVPNLQWNLQLSRHKYTTNRYGIVEGDNAELGTVLMADAPISKKVYVHNPTSPRSARNDSKSTIVVTNPDRVRFEKLRADDQYDYEMHIDIAGMLPSTWKHAGLPPDGAFALISAHDLDDCYSDYDGFAILAMIACNLTMRHVALSDTGQKPAEVKMSPKLAKPPFPDGGVIDYDPPTITVKQWDELDEKRVVHVLSMLTRLFYRDDGETSERNWREQELRKAVIMYMSGTGGTDQFSNFTNLFMSLELAIGFAESMCITWDDVSHKYAARLHGDIVRRHVPMPVMRNSKFIRKCNKVLGNEAAGRICEYPALNNRFKHYVRHPRDVEYFSNNVKKIMEIIGRLRADAAYAILLGFVKLYGVENVPARVDENHRTSSVILGMVKDCLDRHSTGKLGDSVEDKIDELWLMVGNEAVQSIRCVYYDAASSLSAFGMLVKAAGILDTPDGAGDMRKLVHEHEDILQDWLEPSEHEPASEYDENTLCAGLESIAYDAVMWMDREFHAVHTILRAAECFRVLGVKHEPDVF